MRTVRIPVLGEGHCDLIDVMGTQHRIVNAARVSFGKEIDENKPLSKGDKKLIHYLWKHRHTTPFEMIEFTFRVKVPIFVRGQWHRHRTWSYNEISRRYTSDDLGFFIPNVWRAQSKDNKQGSSDHVFTSDKGAEFTQRLQKVIDLAYETYEYLIENGVAREQARMVLPQNMWTEYYAKVDLHNLLHFLRLRLDPHAQKEIRDYAYATLMHIGDYVPTVAAAFAESLDFDLISHDLAFFESEKIYLDDGSKLNPLMEEE